MELIRGVDNIRPRQRGCVATIGNFDGVHLGHQAVLRQLAARAAEVGAPATVLTFEPQPREFFSPADAPARLSRLRDKLEMLQRFGVARVVCLRFGRALAEQSAQAFIDEILVAGLGLRWLIVGDDFRFGRGREGDFARLQAGGLRHGFTVTGTDSVEVAGRRVSSSRVRQALAAGDLAGAATLLGRPYCIGGRVVRGDARGRQIGFPTANVRVLHRRAPISGVFAVRVSGAGAQMLSGVANVGSRPTVGGTQPLLEAHLFDYHGELYGQRIAVQFEHKLRDEQRFDDLDALIVQIQQDVKQAREFLAPAPDGGWRAFDLK